MIIKKKLKSFSLIIVLCLIFATVNMFSFADNENSTEFDENTEMSRQYKLNEIPECIADYLSDQLDKANLDSYILETQELDNITVKHSDGQFYASSFGVDVKYTDENGEIKFIDTSFVSTGFLESVFGDYNYKNKANSFTAEYSKNPMTGIRMSSDIYELKMSMLDNSADEKITAGIKNDSRSDNTEAFRYDNAFGQDTYVNYYNTFTGIKEDIVLEKNIGQSRFDFLINVDNLIPILSEDSRLIHYVDSNDADNIIYTMEPLFAYDSFVQKHDFEDDSEEHESSMDVIKRQMEALESADTQNDDVYEPEAEPVFDHFTYDCYYEINKLENSSYRITVVLSEEWLEHPELVYPVTIDPPISTDKNASTSTFVCQNSPNSQFNNQSNITVGLNGSYGQAYSYLKADMPSIPSNANITAGYLSIYQIGTGYCNIDVYKTSKAWSESITWNTQPWPVMQFVAQNSPITPSNFYQPIVTSAVKDWYTSPSTNHGFMITCTNPTHPYYTQFRKHNGTIPPKLTVVYEASASIAFGKYYIRNKSNNKYLVVPNATTASGTQCITYEFGGATHYQWEIENIGNNIRTLRPAHAQDRALDTWTSSLNSMVAIYTASTSSPANSSKWIIVNISANIYKLYSASSSNDFSRCLTLDSSGNCINGTQTGAAKDQWVLEPVPSAALTPVFAKKLATGISTVYYYIDSSASAYTSNITAAKNDWQYPKFSPNVTGESMYSKLRMYEYPQASGAHIRYYGKPVSFFATNLNPDGANGWCKFFKSNSAEAHENTDNWAYAEIYINTTTFNGSLSPTPTITHETGHAFGLAHYPTNQYSIMYPSYIGREISSVQPVDHYALQKKYQQ